MFELYYQNMSLVSVIIPYFKKKKFIEKTLNSVLNQTYQNFEVIKNYDDENKNDLKFIESLVNKKSR